MCDRSGAGLPMMRKNLDSPASCVTCRSTGDPPVPPFCLCATQKLSLCNTEIVSVLQRAHCFWAEIGQKSRIGQNWSPCHRFEVCGYGGASHGPQEAIGTVFGPKKRATIFFFALLGPLGPLGPCWGLPVRAVYTGNGHVSLFKLLENADHITSSRRPCDLHGG